MKQFAIRYFCPVGTVPWSRRCSWIGPVILLVFLSSFAATPGLDTLVGFDTAWTLVYDGGLDKNNATIYDIFYDIKVLSDGSSICVGVTNDSATTLGQTLLVKIGKSGQIVWKKMYIHEYGQGGHSIYIALNGDLLIGGGGKGAPIVIRTDSLGNQKWSTWYYDSIKKDKYLNLSATINSLHETKRGTIICAAGDYYPDNSGLPLNNYAAYLELDSTGKVLRKGEWNNITGYTISGFYIDEAAGGGYLLSGNRAVFFLDTTGNSIWQQSYSYMLDGVGSEIMNFVRAKFLRDNRMFLLGQVYEGNCWTYYQKLYYDVWWSPMNDDGTMSTWDTAGVQRGDDIAYDFTQLANGNIVFIGHKNNVNSFNDSIWTFVTDSTGRKMLWERETMVLYKDEKNRPVEPMAVCATPDSGFTVVGRYSSLVANGGGNAFAMHFVPENSMIVANARTFPRTTPAIRIDRTKSTLQFQSDRLSTDMRIAIFDIAGRTVAATSQGSIKQRGQRFEWDFSRVARSVYFYTISSSAEKRLCSGSIVAGVKR